MELKEVLLDILDTPVSPELLPPVDGVGSELRIYSNFKLSLK